MRTADQNNVDRQPAWLGCSRDDFQELDGARREQIGVVNHQGDLTFSALALGQRGAEPAHPIIRLVHTARLDHLIQDASHAEREAIRAANVDDPDSHSCQSRRNRAHQPRFAGARFARDHNDPLLIQHGAHDVVLEADSGIGARSPNRRRFTGLCLQHSSRPKRSAAVLGNLPLALAGANPILSAGGPEDRAGTTRGFAADFGEIVLQADRPTGTRLGSTVPLVGYATATVRAVRLSTSCSRSRAR